jgi:hypothetical protein
MSELRRIVQAVDAVPGTLCLATVVDVVGSAYRGPTARMLVLPDGRHIGTISGGCLERDLCNAAPELVRGGPRLISFDTRSDATSFTPRYNLGCSGIVYVLVERITRDDLCPARHLRRVLETDRPLVVATIYQSDGSLGPIGTRHFAPRCPEAQIGLVELVEQMLIKNFEHRPNALEVRAAVNRLRTRAPEPSYLQFEIDDTGGIPLVEPGVRTPATAQLRAPKLPPELADLIDD